jgi:hypothetical protein
MVRVGLLTWLPVTFGLLSGADSLDIENSFITAPFFVIYTYPIYAIAVAVVACLVNYFGNARKASLVLVFPAFMGAVIVSLILSMAVVAPIARNGAMVLIGGFALSLCAAYCYVLWCFRSAPGELNEAPFS